MRVTLDYGKSGLEVELPDANVIGVLGLAATAALTDPAAAVEQALARPIGTRSLADVARGRRDACVVICDVTRPVPNRVLLPPILRTIEAAGIPRERITILIATGTHRPNVGTELIAMLGEEIAGSYRVLNHACRDAAAHRDLGTSPNGVPIKLDSRYCAADLKITVGLIEPHFMAGYSGGRKLVMPGLAALETVQNWHCPRFLESPLATNGSVEGNPVHEEALAIAKLAPPDMIVDVTLDSANAVTAVFAGELEQAWRTGVAHAARSAQAAMPRPADIVVTSCAGYPLDATFYQAVKGMVGAMPAVKAGGTIVIASECAEGVGSPDFQQALFEADDLEAFVEMISQPGLFIPDAWEIEELAKAARHADITCISAGIPPETLRRCFVTPARTVEEGIKAALARHGADATIVAIPRGPYVIPIVARGGAA
ncbi:MAG TPA: nickel-dependent lactate racemase [Chthonomonadaceae bacterium]|nr:nickel-dependent lactate racemase [Chthonomonadaceae bacterium]